MLFVLFLVFIIGVVVLTRLFMGVGATQPLQLDEVTDYRHNGHYVLDLPEYYGVNTDRRAHHTEGDAYKQDEHKHF